jgi:hypothetical protein
MFTKVMRFASLRTLACTLLPTLTTSTALASKLSDAVTAGDDASISNAFQSSIDLADPFALEASWQLLDTDTGKFNNFALGGDIRPSRAFDIDLLLDFAPRANGVRTFGLAATPSFELDEGDDFYTAFSVPLAAENYDIIFADYRDACTRARYPLRCQRLLRDLNVGANAESKLTQFSAGLVVEQGIYDLTLSIEGVGDHYADAQNTLTVLGRQFRGTAVRFNAVGGLLPTFPILWEAKVTAAYKLRFGDDGWFQIKPLISAQHLEYEAQHGSGNVLVAKVTASFARTIEVTAGYQGLFDDELDTSVRPARDIPSTTHYVVVGVAWLFGQGRRQESDVSSAEDRVPPSVTGAVQGGG